MHASCVVHAYRAHHSAAGWSTYSVQFASAEHAASHALAWETVSFEMKSAGRGGSTPPMSS